MNRWVRVEDMQRSQVFHAEEIAAGDWRYTGLDWSGLVAGSREHVITALANLIGQRGRAGGLQRIWRVISTDQPTGFHLDELGNTWIDGRYCAADVYLPTLIPERNGQ